MEKPEDSLLGPRWVDTKSDPARPQIDRAKALIEALPRPSPLGAQARLRVAVHLRADRWRQKRARPWRWLWVASLGLASAAAGGTALHRVWVEATAPVPELVPAAPRRPVPAVRVAPLAPVGSVPPPAPSAEPAESPEPVVSEPKKVASRRRPSVAAEVKPAPTTSPSGLLEESRLLQSALRHLRQEKDGAKALAVLQDYDRRFPTGQLRPEVHRVRVEALLATEQSEAALQILDRSALAPGNAREAELLLLRAELRAQHTRCREAEADFTQLLARSASGPTVERALFGRASCRQSLRQEAAARADLELYLQRFPQGRFAERARRALAGG